MPRGGRWGWKFAPYVTIEERRAIADDIVRRRRVAGHDVQPVEIERGRKIARTFWGAAWCEHLESFSDFASRLPRGRSYVRNGAVCHLEISKGKVKALVSGSELYEVKVQIQKLPDSKWQAVKKQCAGEIGSLLELLQGKFSERVMSTVTDRRQGLFPLPTEIRMDCNCPDIATMCKHIAAVLYGVGARLDTAPELLFLMRDLDHEELIEADATTIIGAGHGDASRRIAESELADIFGIDVIEAGSVGEGVVPKLTAPPKPSTKQSSAKKAAATKKGTATKQSEHEWIAGASIREKRRSFGMTESEFAQLVGVTPATIKKWEARRGRLKLTPRSYAAASAVFLLSKKQAWKKPH
ncbi:MAG: helix-turn-helix domain-containing protein [Candidatus Obscuribacterales bacterium]